jgi:DNA-binding transcriptional LysR family regulator
MPSAPTFALDLPATWSFQKGTKRERVAVRGRVSAKNSEATLSLVKSGFGICMLASWLVDKEIACERLVALLPEYELSPAPVVALTAPGRHLGPGVRALIDHLKGGLGGVLLAS